MKKLSALDLEIIRLLQKDGRLTSIDIGEELKVSPSTIRHRLNKLLSTGLLTITARVNPAKIGLHLVALISFDVAQGQTANIVKKLEAFLKSSGSLLQPGDMI